MVRGPGSATALLRSALERGATPGLTDGELVERLGGAAGEAAFAALAERHSRMVYRTCRGILRDDHDALDASQATFLILVRKGTSLRVAGSLGPWLHRVARRVALRARAEAGRRRAVERHLLAARAAGPADPDGLAGVVHEELDRLPERFRAAVVLCDLEGHTCASAAELIGCPVGTLASRLARGRARLRARLARRGLDPAAALPIALPGQMVAAVPPATLRAAAASPAVARLAHDVMRSFAMSQIKSIGLATACGLGLLAGWTHRGTHAQDPTSPPASAAQARTDPKANLKRYDKYAIATVGNMREAILNQDGTVKLYRVTEDEPLAGPLRHEKPIRNLAFFNEADLLATVSDDEVRIWNSDTGELRQSLPGQTISPLWSNLSNRGGHFVTLDLARQVISVRDWTSFKVVATLRPAAEVSAGVLAPDGLTVAAFHLGDDATVELWDVRSGRAFATLRPPSAALREVMIEGDSKLDRDALIHRGAAFWDVIRTLAPAAVRPKN